MNDSPDDDASVRVLPDRRLSLTRRASLMLAGASMFLATALAAASEATAKTAVTKVRRVVTGVDANGRSVVALDDFAPELGPGPLIWSTTTLPANNNELFLKPAVGDVKTLVTQPKGCNFFIRRWEAGAKTAMHKTPTIDYLYILEGTIDLILDNRVRTRISAGEVVIQRGTIHSWENTASKPCSAISVLLRAET
jgi:quercetin dioxygenase-like cupin family protein